MRSPLRLIAALAVSAVALLAGDLTITYTSNGKAMGMSSKGTQTHYYSVNFQRTVDAGTSTDTLVDYTKGIIYTIKHKDKKIEMMTFDDLVAIGQAVSAQMQQMEGLPSFLQGLTGGAPAEAKVEPKGADTVAGRACKKYRITVGKMVTELSADPTLKPPTNPAAYAKFMRLRGNMFAGPGMGNMRTLYTELSKIQGITLRSHMTGMAGMDSTLEATEVKTTDIPASTFALPAGYAMEDVGKKTLKQLKKG